MPAKPCCRGCKMNNERVEKIISDPDLTRNEQVRVLTKMLEEKKEIKRTPGMYKPGNNPYYRKNHR